MAVYAICEKCQMRRERCDQQTAHKRFTTWVADVRLGRKNRVYKYYNSELENPKELADSFARKIKTDHERGELKLKGDKAAPVTFGEVAEKYWIEHAMVEGRKPKRSTYYTVELIKKWIGVDRRVNPLSDEEIEIFENDLRSLQRKLRAEGLTGATVNRYFNIIRSIFERGREWHMIKTNPCEFVGRLQEDEPALRFLEQSEIDNLFDTARNLISEYGTPVEPYRIQRVIEFMTVLGRTGARPSSIEECNFDNDDVDFQNKVIWFTTYKGGRHQKKHRYPVPMDEEVFSIVMRRAEATQRRGPVFDCLDMPKLTRQVVVQSGVNKGKPKNRHFTMYGLKHCLASHLLMSGASEREVADLFGQTDTRMIHKHYGHLTIGHLRKVQERMVRTPIQLKAV